MSHPLEPFFKVAHDLINHGLRVPQVAFTLRKNDFYRVLAEVADKTPDLAPDAPRLRIALMDALPSAWVTPSEDFRPPACRMALVPDVQEFATTLSGIRFVFRMEAK